MPTFCRHNRFIQNCPICTPREAPGRAASPRSRAASSSGTRTPSSRSGMRVVRTGRAANDGFRSGLVPGLKSSADAGRLADELAFSAARLAQLATDPPGLFAEVAAEPDREEATWLAFLIAYLSPLDPPPPAGSLRASGAERPVDPLRASGAEGSPPHSFAGSASASPNRARPVAAASGQDPFAGIRAAHVPWSTGELPAVDGVALGPRTAHDPSRGGATVAAYRAWVGRAGSQRAAFTGEPSWTAERRFARALERLALPGLHRAARFDLLTSLGRLGLYDLRADSLHLGTGDATELAAKRVFGIGDRALLERRAAELADAAEVPLEALDLALVNFGRDADRIGLGSTAEPDERSRERIRAALGAVAHATA